MHNSTHDAEAYRKLACAREISDIGDSASSRKECIRNAAKYIIDRLPEELRDSIAVVDSQKKTVTLSSPYHLLVFLCEGYKAFTDTVYNVFPILTSLHYVVLELEKKHLLGPNFRFISAMNRTYNSIFLCNFILLILNFKLHFPNHKIVYSLQYYTSIDGDGMITDAIFNGRNTDIYLKPGSVYNMGLLYTLLQKLSDCGGPHSKIPVREVRDCDFMEVSNSDSTQRYLIASRLGFSDCDISIDTLCSFLLKSSSKCYASIDQSWDSGNRVVFPSYRVRADVLPMIYWLYIFFANGYIDLSSSSPALHTYSFDKRYTEVYHTRDMVCPIITRFLVYEVNNTLILDDNMGGAISVLIFSEQGQSTCEVDWGSSSRDAVCPLSGASPSDRDDSTIRPDASLHSISERSYGADLDLSHIAQHVSLDRLFIVNSDAKTIRFTCPYALFHLLFSMHTKYIQDGNNLLCVLYNFYRFKWKLLDPSLSQSRIWVLLDDICSTSDTLYVLFISILMRCIISQYSGFQIIFDFQYYLFQSHLQKGKEGGLVITDYCLKMAIFPDAYGAEEKRYLKPHKRCNMLRLFNILDQYFTYLPCCGDRNMVWIHVVGSGDDQKIHPSFSVSQPVATATSLYTILTISSVESQQAYTEASDSLNTAIACDMTQYLYKQSPRLYNFFQLLETLRSRKIIDFSPDSDKCIAPLQYLERLKTILPVESVQVADDKTKYEAHDKLIALM